MSSRGRGRTALSWLIPLMLAVTAGSLGAGLRRERFDHLKHQSLFPSCESCHSGVATATGPEDPALWPSPQTCATCHDGTVEKQVTWVPPAIPRTNLKFLHSGHASDVLNSATDSSVACTVCHVQEDQPRMAVRLAVVSNCLACHGLPPDHLGLPDAECSTCHVPLTEASRLLASDIASLPRPDSHDVPGFSDAGHGSLATGGHGGVAASCATCHARNFCLACHVNAPEVGEIQALAIDARLPSYNGLLKAPPSHAEPSFLQRHGGRSTQNQCAVCHTQESCLACHAGTPAVASRLPASSRERGIGAVTTRLRPASHGADFSDAHAADASARLASCAACHTRPQCLDCHVPNPAGGQPGYHRAGFLELHPVQAYQREASCSDCHNPAQFCTSCHVAAGLARVDLPLNAGFHDAKRFFTAGHGQAARQSLESCVSCHTETDCMSCHATALQGGRNFSPHGPGFDAARLRRRNPQMCTACHGAAIPGE